MIRLLALLLPVAAAAADLPPRAPRPLDEPAKQRVVLWPTGAPGVGARRTEPETAGDYWVAHVNEPSLTVFPADPRHRNGAAIVVVPGGGHRLLVWTTEGVDVAPRLNQLGVTAFVLKYRLAREAGSPYAVADAAADLRRAVRWVRAHAAAYGVDPHRVGVMGFSAGGELVTMVSDDADLPMPAPADAIDRGDARPDFQVLVFPGPGGLPATATATAPPAFLAAGSLDRCCAAPALDLYGQLRAAGVPAELHLYAGADHAFNLGERSDLLSIQHWPDRLADWLADNGWLDAGSRPVRR